MKQFFRITLALAILLCGSAAWLPGDLTAAGLPDGPVQVAKLVAADGASSSGLGNWVTINGDTALIGAPYADIGGNTDQGAAYIFYRDRGGPGAWGQVAKLIAPDGGYRHLFGTVALSGDTAIVGAPFFGGNYHGKAYVYYRNQGGQDAWGLVTSLTASDGAGGDFYGNAVAVDGDTIMVGANQWYSKPGAVYVYYRNQGGPDAWGQVAKLTASDGGGDEYFGGSVALQGDTAVIAAPYAPRDGPTLRQGKVYIFYRDQGGPDIWGEVAKLTTPDAAAWGHFGYRVSLSGDTTVVGSLFTRNQNQQGAAYVFYRNQGGPDAWGQVAKLTPANAPNHQCFGIVAVSGDTALVGDYWDGGFCNLGLNSAYIYHRNQGGADAWGQAAELTPNDVAARDGFGVGVSLSGDTAVVGAWGADVGGKIDQGAAYVFYGIRANQPPVADAGGPYTVAEGGSVTLNGSGSSDPDPGDTLTYAWDLNGDGVYESPGATSSFTALDGPANRPVTLQVCDPQAVCDTDTTTVGVTNVLPTANAGADVTVYRNETVALAGTWADPAAALDEPYAWTWDLDGDGAANASGSAAYGATVLTTTSFATEGIYDLTFTVTDADGASSQDSLRITVLNQPPVADTGGPYTAVEGSSVTLDGTGSSDPDPGDTLTYAWDLNNDGVFETAGATFSFFGIDGPASQPVTLQVCDPQAACDIDTTTVEVTNVAPTANAGTDVTVHRNETVALTGTWADPAAALDAPYAWSWDRDGDGVADVSGSAAYGATAPATASFAIEGSYNLTFTVTDADGASGQDTVRITVRNRAPECPATAASPALLWPPNNKFVPVAIGGTTDADGDALILAITSIRQDELVGTGKSAPDGKGIGAATAELRAEKLGSGDGRVYHISFTASDGHGGVCTSVVRVTVPHDQAKPAGDGGPLYDSTIPTP